jgi:hypothetical protein
VTAEAPRVHLPHVETGNALDDPLGDQLAHPAGAGETVGAEARGDPEASYVRLPEDELPIGREGFRPVDQPHHFEVLEIRHADDRVLEELVEALPILGQELAVEVLRNPVQSPGRRVALVATHHEATRLPAEVDEERGVSHRRQVEREVARARDEILVRHRHDRDVHFGQPPDLTREHPSRVDHDLRLDPSLVRLDAGDSAARHLDPRDGRVRVDLRASAARALGEGEGQLAGIDVAVRREVRRAEDAVHRHRREELLRLLRRNQLDRKPEGLPPPGLPPQLLHAFFRRCEPERANLVPPGLEPHLLFEPPVEVNRVHHHLRQAERAAQLAD